MKSTHALGMVALGLSALVGCGGAPDDGAASADQHIESERSAAAGGTEPANVSALWDAMMKAFAAENVRAFRNISIAEGFTADDFSSFLIRATKAVSVADSEFTPPLGLALQSMDLWDLGDEDEPSPDVRALRALLDRQHTDRKLVVAKANRGDLPAALLFSSSTMLVGMCMLTTNTNETKACHVVGKNLPADRPAAPPGEDAP